jgi:hypothetical protein
LQVAFKSSAVLMPRSILGDYSASQSRYGRLFGAMTYRLSSALVQFQTELGQPLGRLALEALGVNDVLEAATISSA